MPWLALCAMSNSTSFLHLLARFQGHAPPAPANPANCFCFPGVSGVRLCHIQEVVPTRCSWKRNQLLAAEGGACPRPLAGEASGGGNTQVPGLAGRKAV